MDPRLIKENKRCSIYNEKDYEVLCNVIGGLDSLVVLPNIWTEVDNLLHDYYNKGHKVLYVDSIIQTIKNTTEKYLKSSLIEGNNAFCDLGLTDTLILEHAKNCKLLITSDSTLSDYAISKGIKVFDMKKTVNEKLK
ncbi:MAG TPA: hypothetical protein VLY84_08690 [Dysgonamonadaceae bacterium]|nr:hypothetical protein [Dysgonamonadaceae bacterium]